MLSLSVAIWSLRTPLGRGGTAHRLYQGTARPARVTTGAARLQSAAVLSADILRKDRSPDACRQPGPHDPAPRRPRGPARPRPRDVHRRPVRRWACSPSTAPTSSKSSSRAPATPCASLGPRRTGGRCSGRLRHAGGARSRSTCASHAARSWHSSLIEPSDIVIENFRPGTLERWNLGYEQMRAVNPGVILVRVSAYGQTGPYASRPGLRTDRAGVRRADLSRRHPDRPPVNPGSSTLADYAAGLFSTTAALAALDHRRRTGEGQQIDVSLYESIFRLCDVLPLEYDALGMVRERKAPTPTRRHTTTSQPPTANGSPSPARTTESFSDSTASWARLASATIRPSQRWASARRATTRSPSESQTGRASIRLPRFATCWTLPKSRTRLSPASPTSWTSRTFRREAP